MRGLKIVFKQLLFRLRYFIITILAVFLIFSMLVRWDHSKQGREVSNFISRNIKGVTLVASNLELLGIQKRHESMEKRDVPTSKENLVELEPTNAPEHDTISSLAKAIILEFNVEKALHDSRRLIEIYNFLWVGKGWKSSLNGYDICLATQTSLDRLYWLPEILDHWNGPASIAVHITNEQEFLILNLFVDFLQRCHSSFDDQVALHVAVPYSVGAMYITEDLINEWTWNMTMKTFGQIKYHNPCNEPKKYMQFLLETFPVTDSEKLALKEVYPQNHMRNIARKACGVDFTFSTDIDIIPSYGMAEALQNFYNSRKNDISPCKKCAYVIPTFELDIKHAFPKEKKDIVAHYNSGRARQFHVDVFSNGHNATNYKLWSTQNLDNGKVKISHPILASQVKLYEPFYVSLDTIPPYDERFVGYGFTRNTQFQEALHAGWNFTVLTPVFSIHWGLQSLDKLLSTKKGGTGKDVRREQTMNNRQLYLKFMKELQLKKKEGLF